MTFLAPGFLIAAGVAALAVVGLHFLSTRDPNLEVLPTTRFLPDLPVRATATTLRPTDPWLLLLRVALVLLVGAALAQPVLTPPRQLVARIVAVDVSRAVGDPAELADSARRYVSGAAAVIVFDSAAREVAKGASDSLRTLAGEVRQVGGASGGVPGRRIAAGAESRGSLSAALVAARRVAAQVRDRADSLELVVVSPFVTEEYDAATERLRALWPGRIRTVAVAAAATDERPDSVQVEWADSTSSAYWTVRASPDTMAAVRAGDVVLVYPFVRRWQVAAGVLDDGTRVLARWADGEPAALERGDAGPGADACLRSFGFALPTEGDVVLRPEFQRFLARLDAPCGDPRDFRPLPKAWMASLQGEGPLAPAATIERRVERATPIAPWLLLAGVMLAVTELFVRRRGGRVTGASAPGASPAGDSTARAA